ncbi:hypothetical protein PUN28_010749 [Cardiocondyla obscurior]|uniref:Uncharacterized protein n=1 Tax=Cardiocondyla obscurior TaxID=286306 RepID=A0AAW2FJT6_9HYME
MRDRRVTCTRDKLHPALVTLVATNTRKSTHRSATDTKTSSGAGKERDPRLARGVSFLFFFFSSRASSRQRVLRRVFPEPRQQFIGAPETIHFTGRNLPLFREARSQLFIIYIPEYQARTIFVLIRLSYWSPRARASSAGSARERKIR